VERVTTVPWQLFDLSWRHGPVMATVNATVTTFALAVLGDVTGLDWRYPAFAGAAAGLAAALAAVRSGLTGFAVVFRAACFACSGGWVAWAAARTPWSVEGVGVLAGGGLVLGLLGSAAGRRERAERERRTAQLAVTSRQRRAQEWEGLLREICHVSAQVVAVEAWPSTPNCDEPGYTVEARLGGGATASDVASRAANLASRARLPEGCGIDVAEGAGRDRVLLAVSTHNALSSPVPYPLDCPMRSANDDYDVGVKRDSSKTLVNTRQDSVLIVGQKKGGKSNLMRVFTLRLSEMVDELICVVDFKGNLLDDFVRPWLEGRAERPAIDFVTRTPERAVVMCEMIERIGRARAASPEYARLKREHDTDLLPVSATLPQITVLVDEGKGITGSGVTDRVRVRVAELLLTIQEEFRGEGINIVRTSLRPTGDALGGIDARIQSGVLVMMKAKDEEIHKLFDNSSGITARDIPYPGNALVAQDSERPEPSQTYRVTPSTVDHVAVAVAGRRPALDPVSAAVAGEDWTTRWDAENIAWMLDGAAVPEVAAAAPPSPGPASPGGDPVAEMGAATARMNEIADRMRVEREAAEKPGGNEAEPSQADVDRAFEEILAAEWTQAKETPGDSPGPPPDKDPRVRTVELLREAGRAGASVTDIWQRLAAEGHRTSRQTVNDWFQAGVSEGWAVQPVKRGPYVHADHCP
jgi:hypothetical protein